jgi:hypothetical protein
MTSFHFCSWLWNFSRIGVRVLWKQRIKSGRGLKDVASWEGWQLAMHSLVDLLWFRSVNYGNRNSRPVPGCRIALHVLSFGIVTASRIFEIDRLNWYDIGRYVTWFDVECAQLRLLFHDIEESVSTWCKTARSCTISQSSVKIRFSLL